jgi:hypothetical protein
MRVGARDPTDPCDEILAVDELFVGRRRRANTRGGVPVRTAARRAVPARRSSRRGCPVAAADVRGLFGDDAQISTVGDAGLTIYETDGGVRWSVAGAYAGAAERVVSG